MYSYWYFVCRDQILQKSLRHLDNVYKIPNVRFTGFVCQTNLPPNSAMRGLGIPQTLLITEQILDHVAHVLKTDVNKVNQLQYCTLGVAWILWNIWYSFAVGQGVEYV